MYTLAECLALWGEPEQAVTQKEEEQQSIWLVIAFALM